MRVVRPFAAALLVLGLLSACWGSSKEDILKKAEGADTKTALEQALGRPDDIQKLGPLESWTYKASNGSVTFVIAGDAVTMSSTESKADGP